MRHPAHVATLEYAAAVASRRPARRKSRARPAAAFGARSGTAALSRGTFHKLLCVWTNDRFRKLGGSDFDSTSKENKRKLEDKKRAKQTLKNSSQCFIPYACCGMRWERKMQRKAKARSSLHVGVERRARKKTQTRRTKKKATTKTVAVDCIDGRDHHPCSFPL